MAHQIEDKPTGTGAESGPADDQQARDVAIRQIVRRRRFWASTAAGTIGLLTIVAIWAINEYHNADGWPTNGFSQSSGIHDVWDSWIIYPAIVWAFLSIVHAFMVFDRNPIFERDISAR
jgi:hypothetical protein